MIYLHIDGLLPIDALLEARRRGIYSASISARSACGGTVLEASMGDYEPILAWWVTGRLRRTSGAEL